MNPVIGWLAQILLVFVLVPMLIGVVVSWVFERFPKARS